jgi:hypothetical protein
MRLQEDLRQQGTVSKHTRRSPALLVIQQLLGERYQRKKEQVLAQQQI